jgi:hypothetical protein
VITFVLFFANYFIAVEINDRLLVFLVVIIPTSIMLSRVFGIGLSDIYEDAFIFDHEILQQITAICTDFMLELRIHFHPI